MKTLRWISPLVLLHFFTSCGTDTASSPEPEASATPSNISFLIAGNKTASGQDGSLSTFKIDANSDQPVVTAVETIALGTQRRAQKVLTNAASTHVFLAEVGQSESEGKVRVFSINKETGILTETASLTLSLSTYIVRGMTLDRTEKFLYLSLNESNNQYRLQPIQISDDKATLTELSASTVTTQSFGLTFHPLLDFIFTLDVSTTDLTRYTVDTATGALSGASSLDTTDDVPYALAIHPDGDFLIAGNFSATASKIYNFPVSATGDASAKSNVSHSLGVSARFVDFEFHPKLDFMYALGRSVSKVDIFTVDKSANSITETLTAVSTGTNAYPYDMDIDPTGKFMFVSNSSLDEVAVFLIDQTTGNLTAASTPTYTTGDNPFTMTILSAD